MLFTKTTILAMATAFAGVTSANECFANEDCPASQLCPIQADMPGPFQCTPEAKKLLVRQRP